MAGETGAGALRRTGGILTKQHRTRHSSGSFPSDAASLPPAHPFCKRKLQPRKNIVPSDKISPKGGGKIVEFILTCHTSGWILGQLPARGPGAIFVLAEACQTVQTHFLSWASKKENALQKKEDAKENLLEKVFSGLFRKTEGPRPLRHPGASYGLELCAAPRLLCVKGAVSEAD